MALRSRLILIAVFVLVALVCARLGFWQTQRLRDRRAANAVALTARSAPPAVLPRSSAALSLVNRRVLARGRYDHAHDIVLRSREYRGVPGVEIVSPLVSSSGDTAVLVNRGFVPSPDAFTVTPDSFAEPGIVTVEGIALPLADGGGAPVQHGGLTTWARLDRKALAARLPYPVSPVYLRQSPDSFLPRFPRRLELPALDDGPHLSYAIQWFSFAIIALVFAGVFARRREPGKP
jgi:surfeit locus 1 family protein